ncbi:MAG: TlpA disulfide reductase family protein [Gracilimonas sp.]|jgi:thiol-disulfide isomerase/thioredoxin|nr:TlpA disulfide reductase family protein [Gracilimonas sp.]
MKYTHLSAFLIVLLVVITSCSSAERENPRSLGPHDEKIDSILWESTFQDLEGNEISVQDLNGKVVMIDFWETWCGPCLQVFPALDSLENEYPDDFVVIAVNLNNSDSKEDVIQFSENRPYRFTYAIDTNKVSEDVITLGIPFKVFLDPQGYVIKSELGITGNDYQDIKEIIEQNKTS